MAMLVSLGNEDSVAGLPCDSLVDRVIAAIIGNSTQSAVYQTQWGVVTTVGTSSRYITNSIDANTLALSLLTNIQLYPGVLPQYMSSVGTDSLIYADSMVGPLILSDIQQAIAQYGDKRQVISFFDSYEAASRIMQSIYEPQKLMRIAYNASPAAYINAVDSAMGDSVVDHAIMAMRRLSYSSYLSTAILTLGTDVLATLATTTVLKHKDFSLAEHDIYGSSRLGIKTYYPLQVGVAYDQAHGYFDTVRLWNRSPWYSAEYQDLIKNTSTDIYGNALNDMLYTQHATGLRQYEVTDHLGDVLATLSDKRAIDSLKGPQTTGSMDSIYRWKPVVVSAYDYYPFGQYMPGRYTEDNNTYCFTTTLTEMVTQVYYTPILIYPGWNDGTITPHGSPNVTPILVDGIQLEAQKAGDGISLGITTLDPMQAEEIQFSIPAIQGAFRISLTDDSTGKVLASTTISQTQGMKTIYKLSFKAVGRLGTLDISALSGKDVLQISYLGIPHDTLVAQQVVATVCNSEKYRYGFNGKLKDNEWAGVGNSYDYGARMEDSRIGRFRSIDPLTKKFPMLSPYQFASNTPIQAIDLDGKEAWIMVWGSQSSDKNGERQIGHAAIVVQNYDNKGVPTGTYTYYDLWPGEEANVTNPTQSVAPLYQHQPFEMKNTDGTVNTNNNSMEGWASKNDPSSIPSTVGKGNPEASEKRSPDGILRINLSPEQTMGLTNNINNIESQNQQYNGRDNNCSTFISSVLNNAGIKVSKEDNTILIAPLKGESIHQSFYTPNNLYNQAKKSPNATVVKDAGKTTGQNYNDAVIKPAAKSQAWHQITKP